jgi:hypothetical protein
MEIEMLWVRFRVRNLEVFIVLVGGRKPSDSYQNKQIQRKCIDCLVYAVTVIACMLFSVIAFNYV